MTDNYIRIIDIHGVVRIVGTAPPAPNATLECDGKTLRTHRIRVILRDTYQTLISFIGAGWGAHYPITHHTTDEALIDFLTAITHDPKNPGIGIYSKGPSL